MRDVRDSDAAALIELVAAAYSEHPGCVLDLEGVDADLSAPASSAAARGGRWWVLDDAVGVVATVGVGSPAACMELKRLYVAPRRRRHGIGARLVRFVEAHARNAGAKQVELWSDTRFEAAHRLYEQLGYVRTGEQRRLHDPSDTVEWRFARGLGSESPLPDLRQGA